VEPAEADAEKAEPPPPPSERDTLMGVANATLQAIKTSIDLLRSTTLRLDEIGEPVSRTRTRVSKLDEVFVDLVAHFDYDLTKGLGKQTKDQKGRQERHELS
jgi:hypothetical protein